MQPRAALSALEPAHRSDRGHRQSRGALFQLPLASRKCVSSPPNGAPPPCCREPWPSDAIALRYRLDSLAIEFAEQSVRGILRPPKRKPPFFGVAVGLLQRQGQMRFTFSTSESMALCEALLGVRQRPDAASIIRSDVYRWDVNTGMTYPCSKL